MSAAFTPGPWYASCPTPFSLHVYADGAEGDAIVVAQATRSDDENKANARLIAAAPELLAALEHVLNGALSLPRFAEDEGRAALAKARGEL